MKKFLIVALLATTAIVKAAGMSAVDIGNIDEDGKILSRARADGIQLVEIIDDIVKYFPPEENIIAQATGLNDEEKQDVIDGIKDQQLFYFRHYEDQLKARTAIERNRFIDEKVKFLLTIIHNDQGKRECLGGAQNMEIIIKRSIIALTDEIKQKDVDGFLFYGCS